MPRQPPRVVTTHATPQDVLRALRQVPRAASGRRVPTGWGAVTRQLYVRVGLQALDLIQQAFVVKSRGGTDEAGERWQPLAPSTVARRNAKPRRRPRGTTHPSAALTPKQRQRWWELYKRGLAWFKGDKAHAAAGAWVKLRAEGGARTLAEKFGLGQVEILRDTGLLKNSLSPGVPPDAAGSSPPRVKHQVFRLGRGEVTIGTNRQGAAAHHRGLGHVPERRLWPRVSRWPARWWQLILGQLRQGVVEVIAHALES